MEDTANFISNHVLPHWPFVAGMCIFMIVGQVMNKNVFTKTAHIGKGKWVWFFWWGRKTLALHPIVAGMILGMFWRNPETGVDTLVESMGYFALAGGLSVWAYEFLKGIAKKEGYNISLPGVDDRPSSTPPAGE